MDYDRAKQIGNRGEARVAAILDGMKATYGFIVLHDVLLEKPTKSGSITAQLDHVIVDRSGLLIIESKLRNALIMGTNVDSKWTAVYRNGPKKSFQNPLRQNDGHIGTTQQVLQGVGVQLPPDSVRGMVVMVDADISKLRLDSISATRVASLEGLEQAYAARHEFMVSEALDEAQQAVLAEWLQRLNRSNDPRTQKVHSAYRAQFASTGGATPPAFHPTGTEGRGFEPTPAMESAETSGARDWPKINALSQPPAKRISPLDLNSNLTRAAIVLTLAAGGLGLVYWGVTAMLERTAPPWVYMVAFVVLVALGGEDSSRKGRRRRRGKSAPAPQSFASRLIATVFALAFTAVVCGVLYWTATSWFTGFVKSVTVPVAPPAAVSTQPSVEMAKKALRDTDPGLYSRLSNPDQPQTGTVNGYASFKWDYAEKTSDASVRVRTITIMLDNNGRIVGVER